MMSKGKRRRAGNGKQVLRVWPRRQSDEWTSADVQVSRTHTGPKELMSRREKKRVSYTNHDLSSLLPLPHLWKYPAFALKAMQEWQHPIQTEDQGGVGDDVEDEAADEIIDKIITVL